MKTFRQIIIVAATTIIMLVCSNSIYAQCDRVTINTQVTNSTCAANGKIRVYLSGADAVNIRQDTMLLLVEKEGSSTPAVFTHYQDNTATELSPGTYKISVQAICNAAPGTWMTFAQTKTVTITSSYKVPNLYVYNTLRSIVCENTDLASGNILIYTNGENNYSQLSWPFSLHITDAPASYTGPMDTVYTRKEGTLWLRNLTVGDYEFQISDACSHTTTLRAHIDTLPVSANAAAAFYSYLYYPSYDPNDCQTVRIQRDYPGSTTASNVNYDLYYEMYSEYTKYFDTGVQVDGTGPIDWSVTDSMKTNYYAHYKLPANYTEFKSNRSLQIWIRPKGTNCEIKARRIYIRYLEPYTYYNNPPTYSCDSFMVRPYVSRQNTYIPCYPISHDIYKIKDRRENSKIVHDTTLVHTGDPIYYNSGTTVYDTIRSGYYDIDSTYYTIIYTTASGVITRRDFKYNSSNYPSASASYDNVCVQRADSLLYNYSINAYWPSGISDYSGFKYKLVQYPAGAPPLNSADSTYTIPAGATSYSKTYWYPFSTNPTSRQYMEMPLGKYTFAYTAIDAETGNVCKTNYVSTIIQYNYRNKKKPVLEPASFTCGGRYYKVKETGTYERIDSLGNITELSARVRIYTNNDTYYLNLGDSVLIRATGNYPIYNYGFTTTNCYAVDTLKVEKIVFQLDLDRSTFYICNGSSSGYMNLVGMGGSGNPVNYWYTLMDENGNYIDKNNSGIFSVNGTNLTYKVKLTDTVCGTSYTQPITINDLNSIHVTYTNNAGNFCCIDDSVRLHCISLGNTTYTWKGDGISSSSSSSAYEHAQHPVISAAAAGLGAHKYTINVKPEGCADEINDTIMVYVVECPIVKESALNGVQHNGFLGNPVTVLGNEKVQYKIKGTNVSQIIDTLPDYMTYTGMITPIANTPTVRTVGSHQILTWNISGAIGQQDSVVFEASPNAGVCASQPLFINTATVVQRNGNRTQTNATYHQGGGVAIVTFSTGLNGEIYNAEPQAVDFKSSAKSGVLVVPEEGYEFAGWSHGEYYSMRGQKIPAEKGIMSLDALTIYGNIELTANFVKSGTVGNENVVETQNSTSLQNNVWSNDNTLYVKAAKPGNIISIYNTAGILVRQLTAVGNGTTEVKLPQGVYIVTVNNSAGKKVRIN